MSLLDDLSEVLKTEAKLLTLRPAKPDLARLGHLYLSFGLISAWLAGIGRYWDNPRAELWQSLGLGSVAYVFVLAAVLWLIILPLRPRNWTYIGVLTFVGLTSPPAFLYAVPVERFLALDSAQTINVWFLAVVAIWRVALLILYLNRSAGLNGLKIVVAGLLPLVLIVSALTALNLEHVVFRIMGGLAEEERSANDAAYGVLFLITTFSTVVAPVLLIIYAVLTAIRIRDWRRDQRGVLGSRAEKTSNGGNPP